MNEPLISHEIPLDLIDEHQDFVSDYMFVLLHKAIEDKEYFTKACEYRDAGGMVYLDNSCFELGESLDNDLLYEYYELIRPDIVILPDVLGDRVATTTRTFQFLKDYPDVILNSMAVAQGSTPDELIACYKEFVNYRGPGGRSIGMIGIPFVYSWVPKVPAAQSQERINLLKRMVEEGIIDNSFNHHLLGTWLAREFAFYTEYNWIYSIDTSNPVMGAIDGMRYTEEGLGTKPTSTFDKVYHLKEIDINMDLLYYNVSMFRRIAHGEIGK